MLRDSAIQAFVCVSEPERTRRFYEEVLGLEFVAQDEYGMAFRVPGGELRAAFVPESTASEHTVFGWKVASVPEAVRLLTERGATFERYPFLEQDELGIWTAPDGAQIAWFKDPDGNVLSVAAT